MVRALELSTEHYWENLSQEIAENAKVGKLTMPSVVASAMSFAAAIVIL